jgi:hypothetical protein
MIGALGGLIDTDTISVNRVNFEPRTVEVRMELEATMRAVGNLDTRANARMFEHPMIAHSERTGRHRGDAALGFHYIARATSHAAL